MGVGSGKVTRQSIKLSPVCFIIWVSYFHEFWIYPIWRWDKNGYGQSWQQWHFKEWQSSTMKLLSCHHKLWNAVRGLPAPQERPLRCRQGCPLAESRQNQPHAPATLLRKQLSSRPRKDPRSPDLTKAFSLNTYLLQKCFSLHLSWRLTLLSILSPTTSFTTITQWSPYALGFTKIILDFEVHSAQKWF